MTEHKLNVKYDDGYYAVVEKANGSATVYKDFYGNKQKFTTFTNPEKAIKWVKEYAQRDISGRS